MAAYEALDGMQCDYDAISVAKSHLKVCSDVESAILEDRVAQLENKFTLIDSLGADIAKLRDKNAKLSNENAELVTQIQESKYNMDMIRNDLDQAYIKVKSLMEENKALKQSNDEKGLTRSDTVTNMTNDLDTPSHETEETPHTFSDITPSNELIVEDEGVDNSDVDNNNITSTVKNT